MATRAVESLLLLVFMSWAIYSLIGLMPGDPVDIMIASNPEITPLDAERLRLQYGLDVPIFERYWNWLTSALEGDLGYSRTYNRPVLEILGPRLANTLVLLGVSSVLAASIAIPLGVLAAARPHSLVDHGVNLFCFAGISVPQFWLALLFILFFAVGLGWLPAGGMGPIDLPEGLAGVAAKARYLVLPVVTLTIASLAGYTRFMRAAMIEALRQDYVRTARAKGVTPFRLVFGHALRNAMIPVITIVALDFGTLFSGALITETMFAYLGMGKLIYDAIMGNDYNVALTGLMFATLIVLIGNLLADIGYVALDPRISFRKLEQQW